MAELSTRMIGIVDYGLGNLFSLTKALKRAGLSYQVSSDPALLARSSHIILSGVGHFGYGMNQLHQRGLTAFLRQAVLVEKKPILGICLGLQLLREFSEEGNMEGLNFIEGRVSRLVAEPPLKIPHIGWNSIRLVAPSKLLKDADLSRKFYFTHSYGCQDPLTTGTTGLTHYGNDFVSLVESRNIFGIQCHPEKSFDQGLQILKNFALV